MATQRRLPSQKLMFTDLQLKPAMCTKSNQELGNMWKHSAPVTAVCSTIRMYRVLVRKPSRGPGDLGLPLPGHFSFHFKMFKTFLLPFIHLLPLVVNPTNPAAPTD